MIYLTELPMKHQTIQPFLLLIYSVIGWFLGALAWRTCGLVCAASGMGATTQRKKLAYNETEFM
jgi:hypothetical protein